MPVSQASGTDVPLRGDKVSGKGAQQVTADNHLRPSNTPIRRRPRDSPSPYEEVYTPRAVPDPERVLSLDANASCSEVLPQGQAYRSISSSGSCRGRSGARSHAGPGLAQAEQCRARHDRCVKYLRHLEERAEALEAENCELRFNKDRLRKDNLELQRQVQVLKVGRARPVERLRYLINGCMRDREVRRSLKPQDSRRTRSAHSRRTRSAQGLISCSNAGGQHVCCFLPAA